jgi:uncharacterized protein (TIGR00290 family)
MLSQKENISKLVLNWSSGKDAALAYHLLAQDPAYEIACLLTTVSNEYDRVVMHGVREELLDAQARRMGKELRKIKLPASPSDELYKEAMERELLQLSEHGIATAAFGDIFLDDLRKYREEQLSKAGFTALFPLWKKNTADLVRQVEDAGIEALIVCLNEGFLNKDFLGRKVDRGLLADLPAKVDPCGENGEFHTFVYNAPFFDSPLGVRKGEITYKAYTPSANDSDKWSKGFYFLDLLPP